MDKRGQAALEFIMSYGWALLMIFVGISSLAFFGVFDVNVLPDICLLGPGFLCLDPLFQTYSFLGVLGFTPVNVMGKELVDFYVVIDPEDQYCGGYMGFVTSEGLPAPDDTWNGTVNFMPGGHGTLLIMQPDFSLQAPRGYMGCGQFYANHTTSDPDEITLDDVWNCCDSNITKNYFTGTYGQTFPFQGIRGPGLCEGYTINQTGPGGTCVSQGVDMSGLKRYSATLWVYYREEGSNILHKRFGHFSATHTGSFTQNCKPPVCKLI